MSTSRSMREPLGISTTLKRAGGGSFVSRSSGFDDLAFENGLGTPGSSLPQARRLMGGGLHA